ncbi:hypothetical protein CspeluHIS016_0110170 [Cutaneotrichosporon spelunceum]|uniref:UV excision repair protein RAD23 n=1 Tax=Cutaneotrichosporon spelunceum TaxID=1672016 RepID=A0AAD3TP33_9TREE|nr:hypothetical protein CspeluHIS016_0110170 [Cutaneotrichosporon spelunceum]
MKITFKTVQNKLFTIDADESETVGGLKVKIQEGQAFPAANQKLIYSGKILKDESTVGELKIKEKDFLVVMVSKPKTPVPTSSPAPAPAAAPTAPAAVALAGATPEPAAPAAEAASAAIQPAAESTDISEPAAATERAASTDDVSMGSSFLTGEHLQTATDSIVEMGFPRDQVVRALRASFNNPDRAVEYLMSGNIPETEPAAPRAPVQQAAAAAPSPSASAAAPVAPPATRAAASGAASSSTSGSSADNLFAAAEAAMHRDRGGPAGAGAGVGGGAGAGGIDEATMRAIANLPQIQRIRQAVQENPALIQPLLQQIAQQNPALAQIINENPQALYSLLGIGADDDDGEYQGPQVMQVNLTQEEAAAVERLEQLGFERQMVLQAFLLCDKNEELAANFLFENAEEDEQMH